MDHDQRFKVLLQEFLREFIELFFPEIARRLDFTEVTWLDKEAFLDLPRGAKRVLDLVARLKTREPVLGQPAREGGETLALIHIEVEGEDTVAPLRADMYHYYEVLCRRERLPVLPLALYLRVGLEGRGTDVYEESFWEYRTVRFEYQYAGLPALDAAAYIDGDNILGVALAPLMRMAAEVRSELMARALRQIGGSSENPARKELLADCVLAYAELSDVQEQELDRLLNTEPYAEARVVVPNSYLDRATRRASEQGLQAGRQEGRREVLQAQLETRFGPLSEQARGRLEAWPADGLLELGKEILAGKNLRELGLED